MTVIIERAKIALLMDGEDGECYPPEIDMFSLLRFAKLAEQRSIKVFCERLAGHESLRTFFTQHKETNNNRDCTEKQK